MPFNKGDVVEVIPEKAGTVSKRYIGKACTVVGVRESWGKSQIAIKEHNDGDGWFDVSRFRLAKPEPLVFAVGAQVERTGESTNLLDKGMVYVIETIYRDELGGPYKIKLQGINASYHVRGFNVVANAAKVAFDPEKWIPVVGEKVLIVSSDKYSNGEVMNRLINNGHEYVVREVRDVYREKRIYLEDNPWMYLKDSLRPVNAGKVVPKVAKPAPPPPLELREALFNRQKAKGLGDDLCSYAFETKDGKQHLYPYVCHAMLRNDHGEIVKVAYGFRHDMARVKEGNEEAHKAYSNYIISGSPWKDAFITQDIEEAIAKDILMNVEVNRYMMAGACVALRTGQEYPDRPVIFKEMLDRGHNPHTCWLMSCAFVKKGDAYNFNSWGGGHDVIDKYRVFDDVIKFFQQGYHLEKGTSDYYGDTEPLTKNPFRTHHGSYAIAGTIALKVKDREQFNSIGAWFEKNTLKSTVGEGWDKKTVMDVKALDDVATKLDKLIKGVA